MPIKTEKVEIATNRKAMLSYRLTLVTDGTEISLIPESAPLEFIFGQNQLLPKFESNLLGFKEGDNFDFIVKAEDAYGPKDPYAIFDIPKDTFEDNGTLDENMLQVGNLIPMTDNEGNQHQGRITRVLKDAVTMDFNHPLAGKDLRFTGKVHSVENIK